MALISYQEWLNESSARTRRKKEFEKFAKPGDPMSGNPHDHSTGSKKLVDKFKKSAKKKTPKKKEK